ncbi:GNAT family N-acetyltransferase [Komagataeibacter saccharivorans]|uniref:GNAT family N-acetyltransferase n=1 Tax=Komagataeibacter saccharivorans TaxID=265959 RepID=UPI0024A7FCB7|nr:GNAT family N-acetyltransferase [Komagataeibacter saccharivorans]
MLDNYASLIHSGRVHVAVHDGMVHGVLVLIPDADAMLVDNVAVAPAAQGLGIGRRLLEFAENTAAEAGFSHIRLYTNEAMTENFSLYQRIGYAETHRAEEKVFNAFTWSRHSLNVLARREDEWIVCDN